MTDHPLYHSPLRWGIIGCGDVTEVKSGPAYQLTEGFELTAVMRRDAARVKDFAERHGVPKYYTDADRLIRDPEVDAVYIATPPDSHREYALRVAAAGKPCCVEKPLAPTYADGRAIVEAFTQKNLPLFVAYYRRSLPRFTRVKQWLDDGEIGAIRHVNWLLAKPPSETDLAGNPNWRTDPEVAPGGYFDDLASHGLDLFTFLLGDIELVHGISLNQQRLYGAKDGITACWQHVGGVTGAGSWNFGSGAALDRVELLGSAGCITFSVLAEAPLRLSNGVGERELFIEHPKHVQLPHVENMRRELLGGEGYRHPSSGRTALHTAWVMEGVLGGVANQKPIERKSRR